MSDQEPKFHTKGSTLSNPQNQIFFQNSQPKSQNHDCKTLTKQKISITHALSMLI